VRPPPSFARRLKDDLRLQLDHPWRRIRAQTGAIDRRGLAHRLGDLSELAAVCICVWEGEVRVIEEVEEPCAYGKLGLLPLRHGEGLLHTEVRVEIPRATKLVSALSTKIICRIHEIGRVIAGIRLPVHESRSRCTAVNVWRAHDVGQDRGRSGRACASEQSSPVARLFRYCSQLNKGIRCV
jgi:hypothetical protein